MDANLLSIFLRLAALVWSLALWWRVRNSRFSLLTLLLAALALDAGLAGSDHWAGVVVGVAALLLTAGLGIWPALAKAELVDDRSVNDTSIPNPLVAKAPAILFALDCGGVLTFAEGQPLTVLGLDSSQAVGQSVFDFFADRPGFLEPINKALNGEEAAWETELADRIFYVKTQPLWNEDGDMTGVIGVATDNTKRRKAELALQQSEAKFAAAFRYSPDSVLLSSLPDGTIFDINEGFSRISGFSHQEALGKTTVELGLWADLADRQVMLEQLKEVGKITKMETVVRAKNGDLKNCLLSGEIIEVGDGKMLLTVVGDITERKKAEAEKAAFFEELAAKNRELERFAFTVSHDLKNPLLTIQGFLDLLEQDLADGDTQQIREDMDRIHDGAGKMAELLDGILELSRSGRVLDEPEDVPFAEVVKEALQQVKGLLDEIGAVVEVAPELPTVFGDQMRLTQVVQNLVSNGARFMGEQGQPMIEIGVRAADPPIFFVADNGVGVGEDKREKIFDLFQRLNPEIEGSGVGLSVARRIVEVHGGRIWVESGGGGEGSVFCFTLPGWALQ